MVPVDESPVLTLGVEEEFFLLHPDGSAASVAPELLAALPGRSHFRAEWMQFQVETVTGVCLELPSLIGEMVAQRRAVSRVAAQRGALMVATGTPPFAVPGVSALTEDDRYRWLLAHFPQVAADVVACGCHVHVGVPTRDAGVEVLNRVRGWLPLLLALSGNSPMWGGRDSSWESYRHELFSRWPSARLTPWCRDAEAYDVALDERISAGDAADASGVYWFARLSPRYPTVEIRIADTGLTIADTTLLAALCRALVATALMEASVSRPVLQLPDTVLEESIVNAARHGLGTLLIDPETGVMAPGHVLLYRLVDHVAPALRAAGDRDLVAGLLKERRILRSGAVRQRALLRRLDRHGFVTALAEASFPAGGS